MMMNTLELLKLRFTLVALTEDMLWYFYISQILVAE